MEMLVKYNEVLGAAYQGKRVFLTGHTGFKGSWLLTWLHALGAVVKGYALPPEHDYDLYPTLGGDALCESVLANIMDKTELTKAINDFQPDFVFHLAAQPLVRLSYAIPVDTFAVNVLGTVHVMEAIRQLEKPCVGVMVTTDKVYENREWPYPYREGDRLGGYDPYSASKAAAEIAVQAYRNSFFNPNQYAQHQKSIASARAGNVIGGGDWAKDRIVPDVVRALQNEQPIPVRNPQAVRPWQHVLEPLSGYLLLGANMAENPNRYADAWNFGPRAEDTLTVKTLVEKAIRIYGKGQYETPAQVNAPHEATLLQLDISKTTQQLGWQPRWSADTALEKTLIWYSTANRENALALTRQQIVEYSA